MAIVYAYAALAKVNGDWLQAQPLKMWLRGREELGAFGRLLEHDWAPWVASYAGLLLDLLIVPGLLWRRTRAVAFGCAAAFCDKGFTYKTAPAAAAPSTRPTMATNRYFILGDS